MTEFLPIISIQFKQKSNENEENYQLGDYQLIQ